MGVRDVQNSFLVVMNDSTVTVILISSVLACASEIKKLTTAPSPPVAPFSRIMIVPSEPKTGVD